jgi:hypothetical protein
MIFSIKSFDFAKVAFFGEKKSDLLKKISFQN